MQLSFGFIKIFLVLSLLTLGSQVSGETPQQRGWKVLDSNDDEQWIYPLDAYGKETTADSDSVLSPQQEKIKTALRAAPDLSLERRISPTGASHSLEALLDAPYSRMEIQGSVNKTKVQRTYYPLCADSRETVGKLLYCMRHFQNWVTEDRRVWAKHESVAQSDDEVDKIKEIRSGLNELMMRLNRGIDALAEDHELDLTDLIPVNAPASLKKKKDSETSGLWQEDKTNPMGSPLSKDGGRSPDFLKCISTKAEAIQARNLSDAEINCNVQATSAGMFPVAMKKTLNSVSAEIQSGQYFEALRLAAIGRVLEAYTRQTGEHLETDRCGVLTAEIKKRVEIPISEDLLESAALKSSKGRAKLKAEAENILTLQKVAQKLEAYSQCPTGDTGCKDIQKKDEAAEQVKILRHALNKRLTESPILLASIDSTADILSQDLATFQAFVQSARNSDDHRVAIKKITEKYQTSSRKFLDKLCAATPAKDWEMLAGIPGLADEVVQAFPSFKTIRQCADFKYHKKQANDRAAVVGASLVAGVGCFGLSFFQPEIALICTAGNAGAGVYVWTRAARRLESTRECVSASGGNKGRQAVCRSEDYLDAIEDYDVAVVDAYLMLGSSGISGLGSGFNLFKGRGALSKMKPKDVRTAAAEVRAAPKGGANVAQVDNAEEAEGSLGTMLRDLPKRARGRYGGGARHFDELGAYDWYVKEGARSRGVRFQGEGISIKRITYQVSDREFAKAKNLLYKNVKPSELPRGKSYTWVLLNDGKFAFGQVNDATEFGVKHMHIANGRMVHAGGELKILADGTYEFNLASGTYSGEIAKKIGREAYQNMENAAQKMFREEFGSGRLGRYVPDKDLLPGGAVSLERLKAYCREAAFLINNSQICAGLK